MLTESPPLIPREHLFGNPDRTSAQISPDGRHLAYLAPHEGVLNVWVCSLGRSDSRPLTNDRKRGIQWFAWARNSEQILYVRDKDGDENWHIYCLALGNLEENDLTPFEGVQARIVALEHEFPDDILVAINNRDPRHHDVYRLNVKTRELSLETRDTEGFLTWHADHRLRLRIGVKTEADGSSLVMMRDGRGKAWRQLLAWGFEDSLTSGPLAFTGDDKGLYVLSSAGSNTSQLRQIDLSSEREALLVEDEGADVGDVLLHPTRHTIQAVGFDKDRLRWKVLDDSIADDFAALESLQRGDFQVCSRDRDDQIWIVRFNTDDGPAHFYAYERATRKAELLFTDREKLEGATLARMEPIRFASRDGLTIHGYLSNPPGMAARKMPLVLRVHGGPWTRDSWGYAGEVQWLANRGYAVLQVNFRGSTGYGKKFVNAGNREWGAKMQDDLVDAVNWAVREGIADPERVAIYGGSYGGYAVLAGLAFTPELFTCGVDIVGPSNLITLLTNIPPYWKTWKPAFYMRVGDPGKEAEFLRVRSPLFSADRIDKPLLIAQGANDPRVKRSESLQIVEALKKKGKEVEYVEYADEGHGFVRPENRLDFYARAEKFLAAHLGGRYEA